jgi:glycosyltransferase involved in cell wall biosynthesis
MKHRINHLIMLNQMAGPLFRELAEDLAPLYEKGCVLVTGHPDTLATQDDKDSKFVVKPAPGYNRESKFQRVRSWLHYILVVSRSIILASAGDSILLVSNPPILGGWVWLLTRFNKIPYAVLVYDIHPEVLVRLGVLGKDSFVVKLWHVMNRLVYKNAELVVTIGKRMAHVLNMQLPVGTPDVVTVTPWVDVNNIKPMARKKNPYAHNFINISDEFIILYSGNLGASHDIDSMLMAALTLRDSGNIKFLFIGEGNKYKDIEKFIQQHRLTNIALYPFQPESMIKYSLPLADVSLVSLDQGMEDLMVPSKTFYYLAAGSAIIAIANENSELSDLLEQRDCGLLVPPGQPDILAENLKSLASSPKRIALMKSNARQLAEEKYSRQLCISEFAKFLRQSDLLKSEIAR